MGIVSEFKDFAMKGNVVDMAVGVVIGAGFGKIVSSLVADIITPPLGLVMGGVDFKNLAIELSNPIANIPPVTLRYGMFFQTCFDFLIIAAALFFIVKIISNFRKQTEAVLSSNPPAVSTEERLLAEIRDILKAK